MPLNATAEIEVVLRDRFPTLPLVRIAAQINGAMKGGELDSELARKLAEIEAARAELQVLPADQLQRLAEQARARIHARDQASEAQRSAGDLARREATEGARFYNQPGARADFDFWLKVDLWTAEEAAALILGRDPSVVNPDSLQHELTQSTGLPGMGKPPLRAKFHVSFDRLRLLISRAPELAEHRFKPADVAAWAKRVGFVLPVALHALSASSVEGDGSDGGTEKLWTAERLAKLKRCREEDGTKAAAEVFGISPQRVRQLLPKRPPTASPLPVATRHRVK
jgi:hypothetical protein